MRLHPYREPAPRGVRVGRSGDPDVDLIYTFAIVLGGVRLAVAFAVGETLGAEAAVAGLLVVGAILGWLLDR